MDAMRDVLARVRQSADPETAALRDAVARSQAVTPPTGGRFIVGARIIDLATGWRGNVESFEPVSKVGGPLYHVRLDNGSAVSRRDNELERAVGHAGVDDGR